MADLLSPPLSTALTLPPSGKGAEGHIKRHTSFGEVRMIRYLPYCSLPASGEPEGEIYPYKKY